MRSFALLVLFLAAPGSFGACLAADESSPNFIQSSPETVLKLEELHARADALITQNDFRGAEKIYVEILLLEPDDEIAYTNLGYLYLLLGEYVNAKNAFGNALAINPENEMALVGLNKIMDPDGMGLKQWPDEPATTPKPAPAEPGPTRAVPATMPASPQRIQTALKNAGLYNGAVDGILGSASKKAIRAFQESRGIKPDGVVGPKTWALLEPYLKLRGEESRSAMPTPSARVAEAG